MKKPALRPWLRIAKFSLFSLVLGISAVAATLSWLGLDDNSLYSSSDTTLETVQKDEEIGFKNVASLIARFVQGQARLRKQELQNPEILPTLGGERKTVFNDLPAPTYATRDVHRKTNGCFAAELDIVPNLFNAMNARIQNNISRPARYTGAAGRVSEPLKQLDDLGVFQPGAKYDAIVRFSNGHPLNRPDDLPDARGFAVKILSNNTLNRGDTISSYSGQDLNQRTILDILSINFPTFFVNEHETAAKYLTLNQHFLHGTYDFRNYFLKTKITEALATFGAGLSSMEIRLALAVNGSIIKSPLFQEYFSMVPSRLGAPGAARAVKYIWSPIACSPTKQEEFKEKEKNYWPAWAKSHDFSDPTKALFGGPKPELPRNALRESVTKLLKEDDSCFALYLQPYIDQDSTNIEDSTDIWLRSEAERQQWLTKIVPDSLNPLWLIGSQNRDEYIKKIQFKMTSQPVLAGVLKIKKLDENSGLAANSKTCEDLSFNPWNGDIYHHKPLGVISRLKRRVYNASRRMRHSLNGIRDSERSSK